jgi:hypothetical protein
MFSVLYTESGGGGGAGAGRGKERGQEVFMHNIENMCHGEYNILETFVKKILNFTVKRTYRRVKCI